MSKTFKKGIALDIDETISDTNTYWFGLLMDRFGNPEKLSIQEMVIKYKYTQYVPYWQESEQLEFMEMLRNDNELQMEFARVIGSLETVNRINQILPIISYITLRPENVREGTSRWLTKHGFPEGELIMKPDDVEYEKGYQWKAEIIYSFYPKIIGIIDDNPRFIEYLPSNYKGKIFLFNCGNEIENNMFVQKCENWEKVFHEVLSFVQGLKI